MHPPGDASGTSALAVYRKQVRLASHRRQGARRRGGTLIVTLRTQHSRLYALALFATLCLPLPALRAADATGQSPKPHIVFILADDLGWKDVGFHGSEIKTANLDRLAAAGTRLEQFYVMPVCTPTRACLMSGRYPMRQGLQVGVIRPWANYGLPLPERTLPQALKEAGYQTHIVGKWHLGHFEPAYLPMARGFEHHYGHYNGAIGYFTHQRDGGLDWHRDGKALREEGYSTELLGAEAVRIIEGHDVSKPLFLYVPFNAPHTPLEVPDAYLKEYKDIKEQKRRTYAAMVTCEDAQIGRIVAALEKRGMMQNTLLVFSSDNGGPLTCGANNGPLRGGKGTLYEGGVRVPAFAVWQGKLAAGTAVTEPLHMVDWYPTLLKLAGAAPEQTLPLDGLDAWPTIAAGKRTPHEEILHNTTPQAGALRRGDWKLVVNGGKVQEDSEDEQPTDWAEHTLEPAKKRGSGVELFNIADDPYEKTNLAEKFPEKVKELKERLDEYAKQAAPPKGGAKPKRYKAPKVWGEND